MSKKVLFIICVLLIISPIVKVKAVNTENPTGTTGDTENINLTTEQPSATSTDNGDTDNTLEDETTKTVNQTTDKESHDIGVDEKKAAVNEKVNSLKEELQKSDEKKGNIKKDLSDIRQYVDQTEKAIMDVQNNLNDTNSKVAATEAKVTNLIQSLNQTQKSIIETTNVLNEQKVKLGQTISFMYENKDLGFFQFFFQTQNLRDFLNTYEFANIIADENEKIYKAIKEKEAALKKQEIKLERDREILEDAKTKLIKLTQQQLKQKADLDVILNANKERETQKMNELADEEKASEQLNNEIKKQLESLTPNKGTTEVPLAPNQTLVSPLKADTYTISSVYGYRMHPVLGYARLHDGIDMAASLGTPIYSAGNGKVLFAGSSQGYGNWIVIQHDNGLITIYGHMDNGTLMVTPNQRVEQGQQIAVVGNSGLSSGPHLHFSVATKYDGSTFTYVDPLTVLK